mgnify:CR=1 FL=1|tara:strand:+ start:731 stop:946 length:216 start_codon:yes stop_codon:yes gene_type:complete
MSNSNLGNLKVTTCELIEERLSLLESSKSSSKDNGKLQEWHDNLSKYGTSKWLLTLEKVQEYQERIRVLIG